ncbi:MAG TPA: malto-oligosyltrehalose trehalohydrolase [Terracidiphilus sp.]|nr:malto-oligosyltrehalose trehalohydrolase [Terracidiphilus sp.]
MHRFEVWAPFPGKVAVQLDDAKLPMQGPDEQGWWRLDVADAHAGSDYSFLLDDDPKGYPDPRSQWQPQGVHLPSRIYDQNAFQWTDQEFRGNDLTHGIVYELHTGTFTPEGTLDAAMGKLDHLIDLGITHVELMPVASFAGRHGWGYDGVSLFAVHEPYGGPDALKRFVNAAHSKGLSVLLDVVYNHFGPVGNYTGKYGAYLTESHRTPWGGAVNLEDAWSHQVRRFFCDNALMWLRDFHLDGLRLDAVHAFIDRSAIHFLEQLATEVDTLRQEVHLPLVLIAESDLNDPRVVIPRDMCGLGMDAQWSDDFHHALFTALSPVQQGGYYADFGKLADLAKAIERNFVYNGIYSPYRKRIHGRPVGEVPHRRFLGYIQNHDQVGNRAIGDRVHEIAGLERAKIAAAMVLLGPFIPLIFQGEEWAASSPFQYFADHDDRELARLVSEGRRREFAAFGWSPASIPDPESPQTFERSKLKWDELTTADHVAMFAWYRDLIQLRKSIPALRDDMAGRVHAQFDNQEKWFTMQHGNIAVSFNLADRARPLPMAPGARVALSSSIESRSENGQLVVAPNSVVVIELDS